MGIAAGMKEKLKHPPGLLGLTYYPHLFKIPITQSCIVEVKQQSVTEMQN